MVALVDALNRAYDVEDARPWWKQRLTAILLTIGISVVILVSFALVATAIALVYYFGPDVDQDFVFLTPGSVLATLLWLVSSLRCGQPPRQGPREQPPLPPWPGPAPSSAASLRLRSDAAPLPRIAMAPGSAAWRCY